MKKIIAIGLAGALATASVGATTNNAQASVAGAIVTGVAIGVGVLLLTHHFRPFATTAYATGYTTYSYAPGFADNGHVAWCKANYRSYKLATDSFTGYDGLAHRCVSPAY